MTTTILPTTKNAALYQFVNEDASITLLEKQVGRTSVSQIAKALDEYMRLYKAGFASKGEKLTLHRAFPENEEFQKACADFEHDDVMVVGGPASVEMVDREGHMITTGALEKAFDSYMGNFRTRNAMVLHSDVQVGWALPAYITKSGQIFKSGVDDKGLFFITELRDDTKIAKRVADKVNDGELRSYSIAGSATETQNIEKGLQKILQVDAMELAEVTICEKGVNPQSGFDIIKSHNPAHNQSCADGSCLIPIGKGHGKAFLLAPADAGLRDALEPEMEADINCGSCHYYTEGACSLVAGPIAEHQWCKLYAPHEESLPDQFNQPKKIVEIELMTNEKGNIDFKKSFDSWLAVNKEWGTDEIQTESEHGLVKASKKQPYSREYKEKYGHTDKITKAHNGTHDDPRYIVDAMDGESFTTLMYYAGREAEHHQLLREYGFPSEQPLEGSRYTPVVETETNIFGMPIHNKPPWIVNEAGEALGDRLDEDSPYFKGSEKNANRKANPSISITKSFLTWMNKEAP